MNEKILYKKLTQASDEIWNNPETAFNEYNTQKIHLSLLRQAGFNTETAIAGMPTSYFATYTNKASDIYSNKPSKNKKNESHSSTADTSPTIAFLAEMDALSNMSQIANIDHAEPIKEGNPGHACGHHLLGIGSVGAAILLKDKLIKNNITATIKIFGTPAEETGSGKTRITNAGYFKNCDVCLCWHPYCVNYVSSGSSQACLQLMFEFAGVSAHAAINPYDGKSALDAIELMNIGCNYLREHIRPGNQLHYAVIDSGGPNPGVVQQKAKVRYLIRSNDIYGCKNIMNRIIDCAKGAALMTGTELKYNIEDANNNTINNKILEKIAYKNMKNTKFPDISKKEIDYLSMYANVHNRDYIIESYPDNKENTTKVLNSINKYNISTEIFHVKHNNDIYYGSTDVGDVSWNIPTVELCCACFAYGTSPHSWQWAAQGKSSVAHKGMIFASQSLSNCALDLIMHPNKIQNAKDELIKKTDGKKYFSLLPDNTKKSH